MKAESITSYDPRFDQAYMEYTEMLLRRHFILLNGAETSPELEGIDEQLTLIWDQLDESQRKSLNGMGSDLNWVRRRGKLAPKARKEREITTEDGKELNDALSNKQWNKLLYFLRVCSAQISAERMALMRAQAYENLNLERVASVFYEFATQMDQSNV
jgi:hypothetical protein